MKLWIGVGAGIVACAAIAACGAEVDSVVGSGGAGSTGSGSSGSSTSGSGATGSSTSGSGATGSSTSGGSSGSSTSSGSATGSGSSGSSGGGPTWADYCAKRGANCKDVGFASKCEALEGCAKAMLRDEVEAPLFTCLETTCKEEDCLQQISAKFPITATGQKFVTACQSYVAKCPKAADDLCGAEVILADAATQALVDCMSKPVCDDIEACVDAFASSMIQSCDDWI